MDAPTEHRCPVFTGCKGDCNQMRKACRMPEVCFSGMPGNADPAPAPLSRWVRFLLWLRG